MSKKRTKRKATKAQRQGRPVGQAKTRVGWSRRVTISLPASLLERVDREAEALAINRSAFITAALDDYMESAVQQMKFMASPGVMKAMVRAFAQPGVLAEMAKAIGEDLDAEKAQQVLDFMRQAGAEK